MMLRSLFSTRSASMLAAVLLTLFCADVASAPEAGGSSTSLIDLTAAFSVGLVVIGAVHISQALAQIAQTAGYALEVIDPRTAFATNERFEGTELFAGRIHDHIHHFLRKAYLQQPIESHSHHFSEKYRLTPKSCLPIPILIGARPVEQYLVTVMQLG